MIERAFSTPEAAIETFFHGLRNQDVGEILSTTYVIESGKNYNFEKQANRLLAINWNLTLAPTNSDFYRQINISQRIGQILRQVENLTYSILIKDIDFSRWVDIGDPPEYGPLKNFLNSIDPHRLSNLKVIKITAPLSAELINDPKTLENFAYFAQTYGIEEITERVVLFSLDGEHFTIGFRLSRIGKEWKVNSAESALAGNSSAGYAIKTTEAAFLSAFGSN